MPSASHETTDSARRSWWGDGLLPLIILLLIGGALWMTRPVNWTLDSSGANQSTRACLSNLNQIAQAFAQYSQDYDGKFPRGVDPEDRNNPQTWRYNYDSSFYNAARTAPMLHELLQPYTREAEVWHCPADTGWTGNPLPGMQSGLLNVQPSSFSQFGTSYYYLTRYGFSQSRAADLVHPSQSLLLFDGTFWHGEDAKRTPDEANVHFLNGLYADGHTGSLTKSEFQRALNLDVEQWSTR